MSAGPLWYLLAAPSGVLVAVGSLWFSQRAERHKRNEKDRRLEDAIFGYHQGATKVPGIFDIVVGDGNGGTLAAIAKNARDTANRIAATQIAVHRELVEHVAEDLALHDEQRGLLKGISDKLGVDS